MKTQNVETDDWDDSPDATAKTKTSLQELRNGVQATLPESLTPEAKTKTSLLELRDAAQALSQKSLKPEVEAPAPAAEEDFTKLTHGEAWELLSQLDNENPHPVRAEEKRRIARLNALRKHLYAIQQSQPPAPVIDANAQAALIKGQADAVKEREGRISRLKAKLGIK